MKTLLLITLLIFCGCGISKKNSAAKGEDNVPGKEFTVSGKVTQIIPYCGGARPTAEILENASKPHPYPGKKFFIIRGKKNYSGAPVIAEFVTDETGNFSFRISSGTYSLLQEFQLKPLSVSEYKTKETEVDEECFKKAWETPYYILEVKNSDIQDLYFELRQKCFLPKDIPCLQYTGPMPE